MHLGAVDTLDLMVDDLRRRDDQGGAAAVLLSVRTHLHQVVQLLDQCRYTDSVERRLHSVTGELLRLAGWLSFDAGRHSDARRYWLAALRVARTAGDHALAANILGFLSCQAKDIRPPHEAVVLADYARNEYCGDNPRVSAILALRAAEANATSGSLSGTRRAIDDAFVHLDSQPAIAPGWSYWLDIGHAHGQAAFCYLQLADYRAARHHFHQAVQLQDPAATREGALRYILLATTYVRQNDPDIDRALALAGQAVEVLREDVTSSRCVGHLNTLLRDLGPHRRRPAVRQLAEQVRALQPVMPMVPPTV